MRGIVIPSGLNLREAPGGPVIDQIAKGDEVVVQGRSPNGFWMHVIVCKTGLRGWVASAYIKELVDTPPKDHAPPKPKPTDDDLTFADDYAAWLYGGIAVLVGAMIIAIALFLR